MAHVPSPLSVDAIATVKLRKPYLLFLGDVTLKSDAKTAFGLRDWCPEDVLGEWSLPEATVGLGLARLDPDAAARRGAGSMVIGVAAVGGVLPEHWISELERGLDAGLDLVSGLHTRLGAHPRLASAAARSGARLVDVRRFDGRLPTGNGLPRSGRRVLTVGTDCALGKKYTALALDRALRARGVASTFRATGQTGILIAGRGIAIDAVVADFISGAAETLSPDNDPDHWDVIEGQGSLLHPAYAGVTLGLLHGSQPDAIVLCHDPQRHTIEGYPHIAIPALDAVIRNYLDAGRLTNASICCAGIAINASSLDDTAWRAYREHLRNTLDLPVCDPVRDGAEGIDAIVQRLLAA